MIWNKEEHVEERWDKADKEADTLACLRFRHKQLSHMRRGICG